MRAFLEFDVLNHLRTSGSSWSTEKWLKSGLSSELQNWRIASDGPKGKSKSLVPPHKRMRWRVTDCLNPYNTWYIGKSLLLNAPIPPWLIGLWVTSQVVHRISNHGICLPSSCQKSGWERKPEQLALQFRPTAHVLLIFLHTKYKKSKVSTVGYSTSVEFKKPFWHWKTRKRHP